MGGWGVLWVAGDGFLVFRAFKTFRGRKCVCMKLVNI